MKTSANIQFTGPAHRNSARNFFTSLAINGMKFQRLIFHDEEQDYTFIEIELTEAEDLKFQLNAMVQGLAQHTGWEFVGPRCKHIGTVKHKPHHAFMMNMAPRMLGEAWSCFEINCRKEFGLHTENREMYTLMTYKEFNMMMHSVNTRPEPATLAPVAMPKSPPLNRMIQASAADISNSKLRKVVKAGLAYNMSIPKMAMLSGSSTEEVTALIEEFMKAWPGIANYLEDVAGKVKEMGQPLVPLPTTGPIPVPIAKLQGDRIRELEKQLAEWDEAKLLPKDLVRKSDSLLRFLASLNMQDHSIKDQRDFNVVFGDLKRELEKLKSEQFDGDKEAFDAWLRSDK